jgi:hypothetical protein
MRPALLGTRLAARDNCAAGTPRGNGVAEMAHGNDAGKMPRHFAG